MQNAASTLQVSQLSVIPDILALHAANPARYPHLLASTAKSNQTLANSKSHSVSSDNARFDILFAYPEATLTLNKKGLSSEGLSIKPEAGFFNTLNDAWLDSHDNEINTTEFPFIGGWLVYLAYEMAAEVEPALNLPLDESGLPIAYAARFKSALIIDHQKQTANFISEPSVDHQSRYQQLTTDLQNLVTLELKEVAESFDEEDADIHLQNLKRIHQYIVDGDIFQVNLSRLWQLNLEQKITDSELFLLLKHNNPSPFACLLNLEGGSVISSSPERLVSSKAQRIDTRPIAGTRPRADTAIEDNLLIEELIAHPKERAEHIMLLDLERNDLGRVCIPGSIKVDELMTVESYQHVHHIVSNVSGLKRDDVSPIDIIKAVFPGGTITGCPKVRCMEILAELEKTGRGAYTGSVGYINCNGDMDFNILIRTLVQNDKKISFRAGGGIVADSIAEHELDETRAKAKGMIKALSHKNDNSV